MDTSTGPPNTPPLSVEPPTPPTLDSPTLRCVSASGARFQIPGSLVATAVDRVGPSAADVWLQALPDRIHSLLSGLDLRFDDFITHGSRSCVIFAESAKHGEVTLKIPIEPATGIPEYTALTAWADSHYTPCPYFFDPLSSAILMERVTTGAAPVLTGSSADLFNLVPVLSAFASSSVTPLHMPTMDSNVATRILWAEQRFERDNTSPIPNLPDYGHLGSHLGYVSELATDLIASCNSPRLIHGDLSCKNLVVDVSRVPWDPYTASFDFLTVVPSQRWVAIDPMPVLGDINFDAALWATLQEGPPIRQQLFQLAQLLPFLDFDIMAGWATVVAVLDYAYTFPARSARSITLLESTIPNF